MAQQTSYAQPANYNISPATRSDGQSSAFEVDSKGNLKVNQTVQGGLNLNPYDYVSRSLNSATETWTFYVGGSGGTLVNTIVIVYTDTTLSYISTVTKT